MNIITKDELIELINQPGGPQVSIYLPTHSISSPEHISEDMLRAKNLFTHAGHLLKENDVPEATRQAIGGQLQSLLKNQDFWRHQTDGIAIMVSPDSLTCFNLPFTCEEHVTVDTHYTLAPLLGLLQENRPYYVLAIARQHPLLYRGNLYELEPTELALPIDPETALHIDETAEDRGKYTFHGQHNAASGTIIHGHGGGEKNIHDEIKLQFFRLIDHKICGFAETALPLLLAGTENEVADYRSISNYPRLLDDSIEGNHTTDDHAHLYQLAREHMARHQAQAHTLLHKHFEELTGAQRTSIDPATIQTAASEGRVASLLLGLKTTTPDNVSDNLHPAPKLTFPSDEQRDTIEQIARNTWHNGGDIHACDTSELPSNTPFAAILRY